VAALIEALSDRRNHQGRNALALFLSVLADRTSRGDACHRELAHLAAEVAALDDAGVPPAESADDAPTSRSGSTYNIHINGGQVGVIGDGTKIEGGINFNQ
jgi:hypothetical protein